MYSMDQATTRTIRIGKSTIGLIGIDVALNQAAAKKLSEDEAVDFLFTAVSHKNYIPSAARDKYREALRKAYHRHLQPDDANDELLVIRIFGKSCVSCDNLQKMVIDVLNTMDLAADIEKIHDPDEIGRHGITTTPALMINGKLKSSGPMPTRARIEEWLRELVR
ncbi:MAG: thioredoxin family protein [Desulfobulbaceae bacterium]|nr:thioredoxin family protein [Desulfobulbaceae bacterium]